MPSRKAAAEAEPRPTAIGKDAAPSFWLKLALSALIAFHVAAMFVGPFAFACNSAGPDVSPFADAVHRCFRPYMNALYLDHGYSFFAPDPGPAHLVDYKVEFDDGREPIAGRFPNLRTQRPRLLYHRYFMVAESLNNRFVPPDPPPEPSPPPLTAGSDERALYQQARIQYARQLVSYNHARAQYAAMQRSISAHLQHVHGGGRVTLTRIEHRLLSPDEVQFADRRIDDSETYVALPETLQPPPRP
jgi:hypothetical protein